MMVACKTANFGPAPFIFSTPVWGGHMHLFLSVCLPSLLAPGNLPGLAASNQNRYLIYTRPEDEAGLLAAPAFHRLAGILPVQVILIREEIANAHRTMSDCHLDSHRLADEAGGAAVFLPPDCIWSDGSMVRLQALANSGRSVVHMSGIRLNKDGIVRELARHYSKDNLVLPLGARELVAMGLRHLHPIALSHFWNEHGGGLMPANLAWTVPGEGLLLRCFHLHPLMVKSQIPFASFESTIDDDLALRACPDASRDYVVTDSDELLAFEISSLNRVVGTVCEKGSIEGAAAWAEFGTNERHRGLIQHAIRLHAGTITKSIWARIEAESDEVVDALATLNALPAWNLALSYPSIMSGRLYAASLGRGHLSSRWVRFLMWLRWALLGLRKVNSRLYTILFTKNGAPLITHPYWLVRRSTASAVARCITHDDRLVILIGADPQLAIQMERARPGLAVHAFSSNHGVNEKLADRVADLVVLIDLGVLPPENPGRQYFGKRQILLRLGDDTRPIEGSYQEIRHFGGPGTRSSAAVCYRVYRLLKRLKPNSHLATLPLRASGQVVLPLIYGGFAFVGVAMNVIGAVLDYVAAEHAPMLADEDLRRDASSA
jgi:hypothetical protein